MKDRLGREITQQPRVDSVARQKLIGQEMQRERDFALQNVKRLTVEIESLKEENARLHSLVDEIPRFEQEISELTYEKESLRQNFRDATQQITELTAIKDKYIALTGAYKDLREESELLKARESSNRIAYQDSIQALKDSLEERLSTLEAIDGR